MEGQRICCVLLILGLMLYILKAQDFEVTEIRDLDIQIVNGSVSNEGRVLVRWSADSEWKALCFDPFSSDTIAYQMCRRLGYPFACGVEAAGAGRTVDPSLVNITSVGYITSCSVHYSNITAGGCGMFEIPTFGPNGPVESASSCPHEEDMWLICGYIGMSDFELRLSEGVSDVTGGLVQGRCGGRREWGAVCSNTFDLSTVGRVACRDLGLSPAVSVGGAPSSVVHPGLAPDYSLFMDIICDGDQTSLSECQHYSLRWCQGYATLECFNGTRDISDIDIKLVDGSAPNQGRVLMRWSPNFEWTAMCFSRNYNEAVAFDMCRRLGYPFACGMEAAGAGRTDAPSLVNMSSVEYEASCRLAPTADSFEGSCSLSAELDPVDSCSHDQDIWLSCGCAGMPDFEVRLVDAASDDFNGPQVVQGRCGGIREWGAVCSNGVQKLKAGHVICRELGLSNYSILTSQVPFGELDAQLVPDYTLVVDIGCVGDEASLSECEHFSLRQCDGYATVECFTEIREYEEIAYLCGSKQTCGKECHQQIHPTPSDDDIFHYCQCDDACVQFDDCCYDYAGVCDLRPPSLERGAFSADWYGCVWVPGSQFTHIGFVVVDRCPDSWRDEGTRALCAKPVNATDVISSMPVYDDQGVDFKNIFCALCNGRSLNELNRWDVFGSDNHISGTAHEYFPSLGVGLPTKGWVVTPPQNHTAIRKCPAHVIDTCLDQFRSTDTERACRAYYAPVRLDSQNIRYRNPHCALCNGKYFIVPDNSCMDQVCKVECDPVPWGHCSGVCSSYDDFFTIEVLFDFTSSSSIDGRSCSEGQIYDPFLERCRILTCAAGYQIVDEECVINTPAFPSPINSSKEISATECLAEHFGEDTAGGQALMEGLTLIRKDPDTDILSALIFPTSVREALDIDADFDHSNQSTDNSSALSQLVCNISTLSILVPFGLGSSSPCNTLNGNETFEGYNGNILEVVKYHNIEDEGKYMKEMISPLCLKVANLTCSSLLALEGSEYTILVDEILEVVSSGILVPAAEYVRFPDGSAVMCSFTGPLPEELEPKIRRAISFAGSCLSLLALAATFVTYCVFPELRNTAGKSTMNLVVALFLAILLFLLTGYLKQSHAACVAGAVAAHFAWLASFCWMTVLSASVARTLASKVVRPHRAAGVDRALVAYMCLAWGIPLTIVTICLTLQFCNCTSLPTIYAEGNICWISDVTVRIVVFLVPVAVSLALNLTMYIFTVVNIRRNRHASRAARNQTAKEAVSDELTIYLKICALVGVTWIFGFVSQSVTGILVLSYIYILLNYLQGVFIFITFCLNKRVRSLWREKLRAKPAPHRQKDQLITVSSGSSHLKSTTESTRL